MLRAAQLFADVGISRPGLARSSRWSKNQFSVALRHGLLPVRPDNRAAFVSYINSIVQESPDCLAWLDRRGLQPEAIWDNVKYRGFVMNISQGRPLGKKNPDRPGLIPGDPLHIDMKEDTSMLSSRTMKHFKLFSSPFVGELKQAKDIYQGEEHIFLREMMLETARNAGFTAVNGECGCGKSIMRKMVATKLMAEGIKVVFPVIVDKSRISPSSLIDAIIMDISEETPKRSLEAKTRQAHRLLKNRAASGTRQVLIIEEAHLLSVKALKSLKQIHELEDGFNKLIGIILIGQTELRHLLDESAHPELREVIRRVTMAEITDLGTETGAYLKHKFDRVASGRFDEIFDTDCVAAILQRLPNKAYPLSVNNLVARAMNAAAEMGEQKVTAEVVLAA